MNKHTFLTSFFEKLLNDASIDRHLFEKLLSGMDLYCGENYYFAFLALCAMAEELE